VNIQTTTILLALSLGALACSANAANLDAPVIEASNEPGVIGVVSERVEKLVVDDERLYWIGTRLQPSERANGWFLHSCQKRNCAATLVTYDSVRYYNRDNETHTLWVNGGQIYWSSPALVGLTTCPIAGCNGWPRTVSRNTPYNIVFDDDQIYFSVGEGIQSLSVLDPGLEQQVAVSTSALILAVQDGYLYWLSGSDISGLKRISRTRKDGSSGIETTSNDVKLSTSRGFGAAIETTSIYWTNNLLAGSINRCPLTGCSGASDVVIAPLRAPGNLRLDGSELYYKHELKPYEYSLASCSLPACAQSSPLVEHLSAPGAFALDGQYLYIATTEQDVSPYNVDEDISSRIRRLPKPNQELP